MSYPVMLALFALATVTFSLADAAHVKADTNTPATPPALNHTMTTLAGQEKSLADYQGQVVLMVNVASKCGKTPQYAGLQTLHETYSEQGLAILGFPCNQFGNQEPGTADDIAQFCEQNYGVTFDMFSKIDVNGDDANPLYQYLTSNQTPLSADDQGPVKWNFEKFLVNREGIVIARFRSNVTPEQMVPAITEALNQTANDTE